MAQSGALNHKFGAVRRFMAQTGALWRKPALCGVLEEKPDFELKSSVEHITRMKRTNLPLRGALWCKAALGGALEGKPDFRLKNSGEHYLWCKAAL